MTDKIVNMWKVEEFLIDNLKEIPMENESLKLKQTILSMLATR